MVQFLISSELPPSTTPAAGQRELAAFAEIVELMRVPDPRTYTPPPHSNSAPEFPQTAQFTRDELPERTAPPPALP